MSSHSSKVKQLQALVNTLQEKVKKLNKQLGEPLLFCVVVVEKMCREIQEHSLTYSLNTLLGVRVTCEQKNPHPQSGHCQERLWDRMQVLVLSLIPLPSEHFVGATLVEREIPTTWNVTQFGFLF